MNIIEILKSPYINCSAIATDLWPDKQAQIARTYFRNKLYNIQYKKFSEDELKKIKIILKNININTDCISRLG